MSELRLDVVVLLGDYAELVQYPALDQLGFTTRS
jgi:hypothetical protein